MRANPLHILMMLAVLAVASQAHGAGISAYNTATTVGREVMLRVHTKDGLFSAPGMRVEITVEDGEPRTILTGGDGFGYFPYTPEKAGRISFTARRDAEGADATVLVLTPEQPVLLVEIDGGLRRQAIIGEPLKGGQRALRQLEKKYTIIVLHGLGGRDFAASWMERYGFPEVFLLPSRQGKTSKVLHKRGVRIAGFIGSADNAEKAGCCTDMAISFEKKKGIRYAKNWEAILEMIEEGGK